MNTAAGAIDKCVERFIQEMLALVERAREERRAAALKVVTGLLAETERPAEARRLSGPRTGVRQAKQSGARMAPGAGTSERAQGRGSRAATRTGKAALPTGGERGTRAHRPTPTKEMSAALQSAPLNAPAPVKGPKAVAKKVSSAKTRGTASSGRARARWGNGAALEAGEATPAAGAKPAGPIRQPEAVVQELNSVPPLATHGPEMRANEREAVVLAAVRALVRPTAGEVAAHSGQPNGSVSVALRTLVARGHVARTETARGVEYSLVSPGNIKPFKRVKAAPKAPAAPTAFAAGAEPQTDAPATVA